MMYVLLFFQMIWIYFLFYIAFNGQGHIATGSLLVEEPVHTSCSRCCTVNHQASASNYQLSSMKHPALDSNRRHQRLKMITLTATPPTPTSTSLQATTYPKTDGFKSSSKFLYYFSFYGSSVREIMLKQC